MTTVFTMLDVADLFRGRPDAGTSLRSFVVAGVGWVTFAAMWPAPAPATARGDDTSGATVPASRPAPSPTPTPAPPTPVSASR